jgi:hypothetical protein
LPRREVEKQVDNIVLDWPSVFIKDPVPLVLFGVFPHEEEQLLAGALNVEDFGFAPWMSEDLENSPLRSVRTCSEIAPMVRLRLFCGGGEQESNKVNSDPDGVHYCQRRVKESDTSNESRGTSGSQVWLDSYTALARLL